MSKKRATTRKRTTRRPPADNTRQPPPQAPARRKPGRPRGAKTEPRDDVEVHPSRCRKCGSTDREPYAQRPVVQRISGTTAEGRPYNRVTWKRTRCRACGQARNDRVFELTGD